MNDEAATDASQRHARQQWSGSPPRGDRVVVVAPHPDDEVLAAGGVMRWVSERGGEVVVVAVTDGEASHASSTRISREELRRRRVEERTEALSRLGLAGIEVIRLGVADHECAGSVEEIAGRIRTLLRRTDTVIGPTRLDRHPDHVATADAVTRAASRSGAAEVWEAPTWALVHESPPTWDRCFVLDESAQRAKRDAVCTFGSQLEPLGPDPCDGPVVHQSELAMMLRPVETFTNGCNGRFAAVSQTSAGAVS